MSSLLALRRIVTSCTAFQKTVSSASSVEIFDGVLKAAHRDRASLYPVDPDPLMDEVAERLVDRMEDCTRQFSRALIVGGSTFQVLSALYKRNIVKSAVVVDTSHAMLKRTQSEWQNLLHNNNAETKGDGTRHAIEAEFVMADATKEILPVDPGEFDAVISCLGLHWVNDVPGLMMQCRFALKPDGIFLAAILGGTTLQELRIACTLAQQEREGGVSPRTSPLVQVRDAGNLLTRAGLSIPTVDVDEITVHYKDPVDLVRHLRKMGESNGLIQRREMLPRDTALAAAAAYMGLFEEEYHAGDGIGEREEGADASVPATFQVVYMTGWAPDNSQRQAAKRGSATISFGDLSNALNDLDKGGEAEKK